MGAPYEFLASEPTIQVLSSELVQDAQRITARSIPNGIVYSVLFAPYPTDPTGTVIWTPELINGQLEYWAGTWNGNSMVPGVLGISLSQEVNALGQLEDVALVAVSSTSGKSSTQLTLGPREWLTSVEGTTLSTSFPEAVARARAQLDAVEAGGS